MYTQVLFGEAEKSAQVLLEALLTQQKQSLDA
jgi:hypothetical protein